MTIFLKHWCQKLSQHVHTNHLNLSKLIQTWSILLNLVSPGLSNSNLIRVDHSQTCHNSFQCILYTTTSCEISILRAFWGPLPNSICWTSSYFQIIALLNLLQGAVLITITEFTFVCLYQSMPTMDDDFWTFFLVGITSLNSILLASSYKYLLSRPVVQDVSELIFKHMVKS